MTRKMKSLLRHCVSGLKPTRPYTDRIVAQLSEIGRLEETKCQGRYDRGQLFVHRVFDYRGVILFPWQAKIHDRDFFKYEKPPTDVKDNEDLLNPDPNPTTVTYYQVLIDNRDEPFVQNHLHLDAVTYLSNNGTANLCSIHGLDHVIHDDLLPYRSSDTVPIKHDLFQRFFDRETDNLSPKLKLLEWQDRHRTWLECSSVYRETTENIKVTVIPFYLGFDDNRKQYWWRYLIRLENLGGEAVALKERNWRVFSISGTFETTRGRGVIGREPVLSQEEPVFQYGSQVSLGAPSGHMWGTFKMEKDSGKTFDCRIPPFSLDSRLQDRAPENSTTD